MGVHACTLYSNHCIQAYDIESRLYCKPTKTTPFKFQTFFCQNAVLFV